MTTGTQWLSTDEEHLWRGWMQLNARLTAALHRQLQDGAGLSASDYEVLVHLTDSPDGRVRVGDLARLLQWERSRLSHHFARMERRGLVQRSECSEDGRGVFIGVTAAGRAAIGQAAPGHVDAVRRLVFDVLDPNEVSCLSVAVDKMLARHEELDLVAHAGGSTPAR